MGQMPQPKMGTGAQFPSCGTGENQWDSPRRRSAPMKQHAAITLLRRPDEVQRLWEDRDLRPAYLDEIDAL